METGNLAKWVDELAGDLQKVRQSVNALAAKPAPEPGFTPVIENLYSNSEATQQTVGQVLSLLHNLSDYDLIVFTTQVPIDSRSCVGSFTYNAEMLAVGKSTRLIAYETYSVYMVLDITTDNSLTVGLLGNSELRLISVDGYKLKDHPAPEANTRKKTTKKK